jgi:alpha-galactosidase
MVGAGSFFTSSILRDVLLIPRNRGGTLCLIDTDERRLALSHRLMSKLVEHTGQEATWEVQSSTDRTELLPRCDYVINAIEVSGVECVRHDNDIPLRFGVSQNIGDTVGPGGLFKALRTIPAWIEILQDCERLCPQAQVLNYTNPMGMMCLAATRTSKMSVVGLCHSVQGTSQLLARFGGVTYEKLRWECAGINHLAWFTRLEGPEGDLYPGLMRRASDANSELRMSEPVRSDVMLRFGAFVTESSGHLSEYLPYYRKRKDLLEKYTDTGYRGEEGFYAANWPRWREEQDRKREMMIAGEQQLELERSEEYGAWIIESIEKDVPIVVHGNVPNNGCIENLMHDGCVEVACLVNRNGVQPTRYGRLPKQMAALCEWNMRMIDLATDAAIERSIALAKQALMLDPLTAAVCSPEEISNMCDQMFTVEREFLPGYR